jgi:hypothetical protein
MSNWSFVDASTPDYAGARGRFDDIRSRKQITVYLAYRSSASDERNRLALARWNDYLRQQWEIEHLNPSRPPTSVGQATSIASGPQASIGRPA